MEYFCTLEQLIRYPHLKRRGEWKTLSALYYCTYLQTPIHLNESYWFVGAAVCSTSD